MPKPSQRRAGGDRSKPGKSASNELPPCEGPKLKLFEHHDRSVEWLERLGNNEDEEDDSTSVAEGYVFRARIAGREYAVKIVSEIQLMPKLMPKLSHYGTALGNSILSGS
jgi:hypothetical protein